MCGGKYQCPKYKARDMHSPVSTKTVFKIKHNQDGTCRYKARIVTKGFIMIPGVNYTESFCPVTTTKVGICTIIIGISLLHFIKWGCDLQKVPTEQQWVLEVYNVEAAFLNASKPWYKNVDKGYQTKWWHWVDLWQGKNRENMPSS